MLIEFSTGNYLSFSEPVTLSMVCATPVKELLKTNTFIDGTNKFRLLKTAAVYGNNASGKSNLIDSISFMKRFVLSSFKNSLNEEQNQKLEISNFMLDEKYDKKPTLFEVVFIHKSKRFRYGFEIYNGIIKNEWLFTVNTTKEIPLFTRENNIINYNIRSFKEGKGLSDKTKDIVLFLSVVAQFNGEISNQILNWFKELKIVSGLNDFFFQDYTINKFIDDKDFCEWAKLFVSFLDIKNIEPEEINFQDKAKVQIPDNDDFKQLFNIIERITKKNDNKRKKLVTYHHKIHSNNSLSDISFDLESQESEGTKKLIYLLGPIYNALKIGSPLIVDELDSRFHPLLTMRIIEIFNLSNKNNSQLIFTSHDTNLLKNYLFRRDQIWFTEKTEAGSTDLYSLVEYKNYRARKDASFNKDYLNGKYGAIPIFSDMQEILDLIYG